MAKRVALCISNDFSADRRVEKTANSLIELGWQPIVVARRLRSKKEYSAKPFAVKRMKLVFNKGALFYAELNFRLFFKLLFTKLEAIHSNDLDTLLACYLASKLKSKPLVYDSHEFFTEVPELLDNPFARNVWLSIERFIFPTLKHVVTVNASIATEYELRYGIRPKVVRNIANAAIENQSTTTNVNEGPFTVIMQGAGINIDRGAEELVQAFVQLPKDIHLKIIGKGDVFDVLKSMRKELKLEEQVHIIDSLPYNELMQHTAEAHIGATLDKATNPNYALSLPNKIFDYLRAGLPVVSSSVVEVANIVRQHQCGTVVVDVMPDNIAAAILEMYNDRDQYLLLKRNAINAAKEYAWEKEFKVFEHIYSSLM